MKLNELKIGDVVELHNGQHVEITTLTIMTGDTVGYRMNPNSPFEMTVDISGVVKLCGYVKDTITYDMDGNKTKDYWENKK